MNKSMNVRRLLAVSLLGLGLFGSAGAAHGQNHPHELKTGTFDNDFFAGGDEVVIEANLSQDLYAAGGEVRVNARVEGDVFAVGGEMSLGERISGELLAAGGRIETRGAIGGDAVAFGGALSLDSEITGDALLFGGKIRINQPVAGNVRAAGGKITLDGPVGGNALLGGGRVDLGTGARVTGKATLAGGVLRIDGEIGEGLRAAARRIILAGKVGGDANLRANEIIILESARIGGDLVYRSPRPIELSDRVEIGGDVAFIHSEAIHDGEEGMFAVAGGTHLFWIAGLIVVAAVMAFAVPAMFPSLETRIMGARWKSLWVGFAVLIGGPIAIVLLGATLLGLPLALILGAVYAVALTIGYFASAYALGRKCLDWLKRQPGSALKGQLLSASLGLVLLGLALVIPVAGALVNAFAVTFGLGALLLTFAARRRGA